MAMTACDAGHDAASVGRSTSSGSGGRGGDARAWCFGSAEVRDALRDGGPVVALETAVVTHGLPAPHHVEAARRMMRAVRDRRATPVVVGVRAGRLVIGLREDDLAYLAGRAVQGPHSGIAAGGAAENTSPSTPPFIKASTRDLAWAAAAGADGGTTVAATLTACRIAGIRVFATGGIGGVHRGWPQSLDMSADLDELARSPVAVVSAGAKSILDLPATLEALERAGVPVIGYRTDFFPQFHTRGTAALPVARRLDHPAAVARLCRVHWRDLRLTSAVLIANPIPERHALDQAAMEQAVDAAVCEAERAGVRGAALTPYLLDRVAMASDGRSIEANLALLEHNAAVAAEVALALCDDRGPAAPGAMAEGAAPFG